MNKQVLTRREKESLFRRNVILDAAVGIFARTGYRDTTLDEIAVAQNLAKVRFIIISKVRRTSTLSLSTVQAIVRNFGNRWV